MSSSDGWAMAVYDAVSLRMRSGLRLAPSIQAATVWACDQHTEYTRRLKRILETHALLRHSRMCRVYAGFACAANEAP